MSTDVTVADIYEKTAEVLETEGWIRGEFHSNDSEFGIGYCAMGGMKRAAVLLGICHSEYPDIKRHDPEVLRTAVAKLEKHLDAEGPETCITEWNDEEVKSAAEVIDTFKHLAKEIRNGELE